MMRGDASKILYRKSVSFDGGRALLMWFSTLEGRYAPIRTGGSPGGIRPVEGFCLHEISKKNFFSMSRKR
jgi:hypothetical protein